MPSSALAPIVAPGPPSLLVFYHIPKTGGSSVREWLESYERFPGNHPHNFVALIWLEFGLLGALILTYFINKTNKVMIKLVNCSDSAPYIISIITTVTVLFSLSWSIWQTDVALTYIMFFSCLCFLIQTATKTKVNDAAE